MPLNIALADDHPSVLVGTKVFLEQAGFYIADTFSNGIEAYHGILARGYDMALLDVDMPGMNAIEIAEGLKKARSRTRLILLTFHNESALISRARELDIKGYLLKDQSLDEIITCIRAVSAGKCYYSNALTARMQISAGDSSASLTDVLTFAERKIISMIAQQKSSKFIAAQLFITEKTVETHRRNIIRKLNIPPTKNALLIWAMKNIAAKAV